jgi:plasmid stabilization system protein ParE
MAAIRIQEAASHRVDEIYRYTRDRWGTEQADRYISGLFEAFDKIDPAA